MVFSIALEGNTGLGSETGSSYWLELGCGLLGALWAFDPYLSLTASPQQSLVQHMAFIEAGTVHLPVCVWEDQLREPELESLEHPRAPRISSVLPRTDM